MAQDDFQAFIERIKQAESRGQRFDSKGKLLTSPKGAQGEMQVMPATQRDPGYGVAPVKNNSPDEIARVGRDLLRAFDAKYDGNKMYVAAAYNWGPGNVDKWIAGGADFNKLPKETQNYLMKVAPEALAQSRSRQAPATATVAPVEPTMDIPLGISASASPRAVAIGDSLAEGFAKANNLGGSYRSGAGPQAVMKMLQDYAANNSLQGMTVYLGTGLPNNPAQRDAVSQQIAFIKAQGGNPVVFGAGPGSQKNPTTGQNEFLQTAAQQAGATFTGPLAERFPSIAKQDPMGLHLTASQYKELYKQVGGAPVTTAAAAPTAATTTAVAPAAAAAPARAEDLGSGYKAALALAFLGEEDKDRESTDDELRARLNRQEDEASAKELAEYKPVNALQNLEITALNPVKALRSAQPVEPVRMAAGGVPFSPVARITPSAKAQLEAIKADYDRYNAAVPVYNAALEKYQTEVYEPYSKAVDEYNAAVEAYNAGTDTSTRPWTLKGAGSNAQGRFGNRNAGEDFSAVEPTAPADFSMAAPVAPSVSQAQYEQMAADAKKSVARRQLALVVASDPERFGLSMNKFFAEGGEVDSLEVDGSEVTTGFRRPSEARQQLSAFDRFKEHVKTRAQEIKEDPYWEFIGKYVNRKSSLGNNPVWFAPETGYLMYKQLSGTAPAEAMLNHARRIRRGLDPSKGLEPIERADGGEVDSSEVMPSKGNEQIGNTAPPRYSAREMEAYLRTANPGASVLEYARGMGGAMGFVNSRMPDVINVQRTLTPGTKEQTLLHELEHSMDMKGGDIFGRPEIARMDNNYRAYHLMNNDWRPIEKFVDSVIQNKDKLSNFFGQDIVSGYLTVDPETFKKMKSRGMVRGLFSEQIASLSALEQATGKSLTRDPEMRKIFPNTQMMAVYDALTGLRQTRTDARDLPPHTPLPSYMYETNPVTRFIREKTTGKNEYGIPVKRSNGSPETGEVALTPEEIAAASRPATFNPQIARQGATARALAAQRDVNTLPDPRTYAFVSGLLGQAPDELGFSAMHPKIEGITRAGEAGFAASLVPVVAPVVAPVARAVGRAATAAGMRAEKALEAPVTRTLESGGRSAEMLKALGAQPSFAVRPKGGHFELRPDRSGPGMAVWDDVKQTVSDSLANTADQPLNNWFNTKYAAYLRRDFAAEGDPFVKAADAGKKLHIPNNERLDDDWQATLRFRRREEGLPAQGFATTPYGKNIEDTLDTALNIRELGDLAGSPYSRDRIPLGIRQFAETNPQMRVYSLDEILATGPRAESLRNTMLEMRQPSVSYYGESVTIPKNYQLTNETLQGLTPVQASERAAAFEQWKETARQKAATLSVRKNKDISKQDAGDGYLWVNPPDLSANPKIRQMVQDVGCDGGWCTQEERWALDYGSGNNRLSFLIDNKNRPVAQMTIEDLGSSDPIHLRKNFIKSLSPQEIAAFKSHPLYKHIQDDDLYLFADSFPQYDQYIRNAPPRISITQIKAKGNKEDVMDHVSSADLKKIQDQIKDIDSKFDLQYVQNFRNIGLVEVPRNRPDTILNRFNPTMQARSQLKAKFGGEMEGFQAVLDRAINMNGGSRYFSGNEDEISDLFHNATRSVLQPPVNRAKGGMVERQNTDNRAYL